MDLNVVLTAFGLTLFAGLSTGIGSAIALLAKRTNTAFLSVSLGFSAGVMIYVSFVELFFNSKNIFINEFGTFNGTLLSVLFFFGGIIISAIIDKLVPAVKNPHEVKKVEDLHNEDKFRNNSKLLRVGLFTALAIGIHNFPEGLATFVATLQDTRLGISIAIAIAIHNIPEGIAVSVPVYYATGSRKKAFYWSFLSGLAEPAGALVGYLILMSFINDVVMGALFSIVAGIMVFISLDELLPSAEKYGKHHFAIYGLIAGMAVMALSLLILI